MGKLKIGVIEDEMVTADTICLMLRKAGYAPAALAANYQQAMDMISQEGPDVLLLDIQLGGGSEGIEVAHKVRDIFRVPVIFIATQHDNTFVLRAKTVKPNAWLLKPFTFDDLLMAIEIGITNFNAPGSSQLSDPGYILVKDGYRVVKLFHHEILYLENEGNYVIFHTIDDRKVMTRGTMPHVLSMLNSDKFLRHHRSFSVNLLHLKMIETEGLVLNGQVHLPLAAAYKSELLRKWR
jgi:DNA-binding LytR/AlgR family response regulator